jgi:hypothetical protein
MTCECAYTIHRIFTTILNAWRNVLKSPHVMYRVLQANFLFYKTGISFLTIYFLVLKILY